MEAIIKCLLKNKYNTEACVTKRGIPVQCKPQIKSVSLDFWICIVSDEALKRVFDNRAYLYSVSRK